MKTLIVYSSQSGNTRKLAQTIRDALPGDATLAPMNEAPAPEGYDLVCVGFWLKAGQPDPTAQEYLPRVKGKAFLFATHAARPDSDHARNAMAKARELAGGGEIVGDFHCFGQARPEVLDMARKKPQPPVWLEHAPEAVGHPDAEDLKRLRETLRSII